MEVAAPHQVRPVTEPSQPSTARFLAKDVAEAAGFGADDVYRAGIVATELATNLVKHAKEGEMLARVVSTAPGEIELLALDRGPGLRDVTVSLSDGHSTAGSLGTGLGAVRRMADSFDIFSTEGRGTVVLARLRDGRRPVGTVAPDSGMTVAVVSVAKPGEAICGDAWHVRSDAGGMVALVADGLGHGLQAAEASGAAVAAFTARRYVNNVDALQAIHARIRHTRGAAAALADIRRGSRVVKCVGVGNITSLVVHDGTVKHAVTHNGTLGHDARIVREYSYPWYDDALIVMHSDGLSSHWSLDDYRGLRQRHPAVIAAVLYRDHRRGRDDVTVLVGRQIS